MTFRVALQGAYSLYSGEENIFQRESASVRLKSVINVELPFVGFLRNIVCLQ